MISGGNCVIEAFNTTRKRAWWAPFRLIWDLIVEEDFSALHIDFGVDSVLPCEVNNVRPFAGQLVPHSHCGEKVVLVDLGGAGFECVDDLVVAFDNGEQLFFHVVYLRVVFLSVRTYSL